MQHDRSAALHSGSTGANPIPPISEESVTAATHTPGPAKDTSRLIMPPLAPGLKYVCVCVECGGVVAKQLLKILLSSSLRRPCSVSTQVGAGESLDEVLGQIIYKGKNSHISLCSTAVRNTTKNKDHVRCKNNS